MPVSATGSHEHRYQFLRQEFIRLEGWDDRVTKRRVVDVFFCEDCLSYERIGVRVEVPDPRSFGWVEVR